jgi:DNA-binding MarR family transcriptional regulator
MTPTAHAAKSGSMSLLFQLARVVYRRATEDVIGMKLKQLVALDHLRANEGCLQQTLGQTLMLDPNNCVILLNDLDERGYVERRRDPTDRRRHLVEITPEGTRALDEAEAKLDSLEGEVFGNLDAAERAQLRELLSKAMAGQETMLCGPDPE